MSPPISSARSQRSRDEAGLGSRGKRDSAMGPTSGNHSAREMAAPFFTSMEPLVINPTGKDDTAPEKREDDPSTTTSLPPSIRNSEGAGMRATLASRSKVTVSPLTARTPRFARQSRHGSGPGPSTLVPHIDALLPKTPLLLADK